MVCHGQHSFRWIGPEQSNDPLDMIGQNGQGWKKRLPFENLRFAERYISGNAHLLVRFAVTFDFTNYVTGFQYRKHGDVEPSALRAESHGVRSDPHGNGQNQTVLIEPIKLMEPKKVIPSCAISTVWTKRIDEILGLFGHSLCFSARFGFVDFPTLANWKINLGLGNPNTMTEFAGQMIQSGPEIVGNIADKETDFGSNLRNGSNNVLRPISFDVVLGNSQVSIVAKEFDPGIAQIIDVIFGPFDLKEWAPQV